MRRPEKGHNAKSNALASGLEMHPAWRQ